MPESLALSLDVAEAKQEVEKETAPPPEVDPELDAKATQFAEMLVSIDLEDLAARKERTSAIENAGREVQAKSAHRSAMLEEPIRALSQKSEDGGEVANSLVDLKLQVESLDPNRIDFEPGWFSRMMGALPFVGTPLKRYFSQYESAQTVIDSILRSLEAGREQLKRDNVTLGEDQRAMRELTIQLGKQIELLSLIDQKLQKKLDEEIPAESDKHRFIAEELVYPLRQRIMDLQQQLAVNQQGILAIELIVRNNKELIRGVNRAIEVTVSALQVAVTVALALAHQRIVLDKIQALNSTTSDLIAGTAARLRTQGTEIHKQGAESMLELEKLKAAFVDVNAAMEDIASFRRDSLPKMSEQIGELHELTEKGQASIEKLEQGNEVAPSVTLEG